MKRGYLYFVVLSILISGCVNSKNIEVKKNTKMQMFQSVYYMVFK